MSSAALFAMAIRLFHVDHVLPGDAPSIADAAVVVDEAGVVLDVGRAAELIPRHAGAHVERVRGVALPGLVNAHTHLELSALRGKVPGGRGFVAWVEGLIGARSESAPEDDLEAIDAAVGALVASGTVAVGEVTNSLAAVPALARRGLVGAVFHEVFGQDRASVMKRAEGLLGDVALRAWPSAGLAYAPAPHTLYTTHADAVRALLEHAKARGLRTSLHLAEHEGERLAIERGEGPVPEWLLARAKQRPVWPRRPLMDYADDVGALAPEVLLVHLADARPDELARIAERGAPVVLCPRSNAFIEGTAPPLGAMRAAGLEPALGTDSLASNASLDVLAEARALAALDEGASATELVRMATWNGARALGLAELGRIAKGARPGVVVIEGHVPDDAASFVVQSGAPRRVLVERTS